MRYLLARWLGYTVLNVEGVLVLLKEGQAPRMLRPNSRRHGEVSS
jgi:hypothetical protein